MITNFSSDVLYFLNKSGTFGENNIRVISDPHFSDPGMLKWCKRPYKDTQEMDKAIIEAWNSNVQDNDLVFILGDFCLSKLSKWPKIVEQLKGIKYLIYGNHDLDLIKTPGDVNLIKSMFSGFSGKEQIWIQGRKITLTHEPLLTWSWYDKLDSAGKPMGINIHGHTHTPGKLENSAGIGDFERLRMTALPGQYDASLEAIGGYPRLIGEVLEEIWKQVEEGKNQQSRIQ